MNIAPFKFTRVQKAAFEQFLTGKVGVALTAKTLGMPRQRIYTIATTMMRHAGTTGTIDVKELLKNY